MYNNQNIELHLIYLCFGHFFYQAFSVYLTRTMHTKEHRIALEREGGDGAHPYSSHNCSWNCGKIAVMSRGPKDSDLADSYAIPFAYLALIASDICGASFRVPSAVPRWSRDDCTHHGDVLGAYSVLITRYFNTSNFFVIVSWKICNSTVDCSLSKFQIKSYLRSIYLLV